MTARRIRTGFYSETPRIYEGENILRVVDEREARGLTYLLLENGQWIRPIGPDQYVTDWNAEECWACVEESNTGKVLGFMILRVDRERGLRIYRKNPDTCANVVLKDGGARDRKAAIDKELCRGCRICVKTCPVYAITVLNRKASISDVCVACGSCKGICPFGALTLV
jgi:MinD superfamily P-loop ATPase